MSFPKLPDWAIYGVVVAAMAVVAVSRRENIAAPPAPAAPDAEEGTLIGPASPIDPMTIVAAPSGPVRPIAGTAVSISAAGQWLTARHVVEGCPKAAILLGGGHAIPATVRTFPAGDLALLTSEGGPTAMPLGLDRPLRTGQRAWLPGYPQGGPGEVAVRLLGRESFRLKGRHGRVIPVLAWAEVGRTEGLHGTLSGLSGAPALDSQGRVIGIVIAEKPRRGRIYTSSPEGAAELNAALGSNKEFAPGAAIDAENYGRVADTLRRDLRVAKVMCLT